MNKRTEVFIVGIMWIALSGTLGVYGAHLSRHSGLLALVGWALSLLGFGFAGMSIFHLLRLARLPSSTGKRSAEHSQQQGADWFDVGVDSMTYLVNYSRHYAPILMEDLSERALAELYLFRAWTAQFGFRIFSSRPDLSEKILGQIVNSCKYLGLGVFEKLHGFSVERTLGDDFMSLIEDRWRDYDLVVSTDMRKAGIPTHEVIDILMKRIGSVNAGVRYALSMDFLAQLDAVKRKAIETGLVTDTP